MLVLTWKRVSMKRLWAIAKQSDDRLCSLTEVGVDLSSGLVGHISCCPCWFEGGLLRSTSDKVATDG